MNDTELKEKKALFDGFADVAEKYFNEKNPTIHEVVDLLFCYASGILQNHNAPTSFVDELFKRYLKTYDEVAKITQETNGNPKL